MDMGPHRDAVPDEAPTKRITPMLKIATIMTTVAFSATAFAYNPVWPPGNFGRPVAAIPNQLIGQWCSSADSSIPPGHESYNTFERKRGGCIPDLTITKHGYVETYRYHAPYACRGRYEDCSFPPSLCRIMRIEMTPDSTYLVVSLCGDKTVVHTVHLADERWRQSAQLHWDFFEPPYER
jgi:hypothetical protein